MEVKINNEGYCEGCIIEHNCSTCNIMNLILEKKIHYKNKVSFILNNKQEKKKNQNKQKKQTKEKSKEYIPYCGDCGKEMKKNKFKKGPLYWCPCYKNIRY
ncbi:MAG: hypothetical protein QM490_03845 [Candidatus Gracilibacteria bacterium]